MRRGSKVLITVGVTAVVLVAARVAAPEIVERYVNRQLADMGDYRGSITEVDLHLLAGGYAIRDVTIVKVASDVETPFVEMPRVDLTLEWRSLFRGRVVGDMIMHEPVMNAVQSESAEDSQLGGGVNWPQEIRDLFPFQLNYVEVRDGFVTFTAPGISTSDSMTVEQFQLALHNLTNVQDRDEQAFADLDLAGQIMGNAPITLAGQIDPNAEVPTFDMNLAIEGGRLVDFNPWLREFLKVDAEAGVFSMYAELAAAEGNFEGYVKPILEDPEIFDAETDSGPFRKIWEGLVGLASKILENRTEDQVATQIPVRGEIEDPEAGIVAALVNLMRNAFVVALAHSLEGTISLRDVASDVRCIEEGAENEECDDAEPGGSDERDDDEARDGFGDNDADREQDDDRESRREQRREEREQRDDESEADSGGDNEPESASDRN